MNDEELDHTPMTCRKHAGKTPSHVADVDPSYLVWAYETWSTKPCSKMLYQECVWDVQEARQQNNVSREQGE